MKRFICILCCILMLSGCGTAEVSEQNVPELMEPVSVNVDTCRAEYTDLINETARYGRMIPGTVKLYFETDGVIRDIPVYSGKWVEKGELLITLDSGEMTERLEEVEEEIRNAENLAAYDVSLQNLEIQYRQVELNQIAASQGTGSAAYAMKELDLQQAYLDRTYADEEREAAVRELEEMRDELRENVGKQELYAPVSGYVYFDESVTEGASVHNGGTVMYLSDPEDRRFQVDGYISESDTARFPMYAWINGEKYEVELIIPSTDELLSAQLAGEALNSEFRIIDGEDIECGCMGALYIQYLNVPEVLTLPRNAVQNDAGGYFAYVINDDNSREKRYLETGRTNGILMEIRNGLEEGETVYVPN